jgi:hypothetical protein
MRAAIVVAGVPEGVVKSAAEGVPPIGIPMLSVTIFPPRRQLRAALLIARPSTPVQFT